jgi:peroxiredoxin
LKEIAERHRNKQFAMVGLAMDEDLDVLRKFVARNGINWPQICDGEGRKSQLMKSFNAWSFPRHIVLDRDGKIVFQYYGVKAVPKVAGVVAELLRD